MRTIFFALLVSLTFVACKRDQAGSSNDESNRLGSAAPAETPPTDMRETRVLQSRFWVVEHWVDVDMGPVTENTGRWYRFYEDGTFDAGHWEDHNDHGNYFLRKGERYTELYVDSEINDLNDAKWQVQGIDGAEQSMSWVKTKDFGDGEPAMCKLTGMLTMPTKKQWGLE